MITIVYPYVQHLAAWQELKYSLRSVEKYFKESFKVLIVGDLPEWIKDVQHIPHTRISGIELTNCFDAITKLQLMLNSKKVSDDFIIMYDDIYLLKDTRTEDLQKRYYLEDLSKHERPEKLSNYQKIVFRTVDMLKREGLATLNCETHLPRLYNKNKMRMIMKLFRPRENRLLTGTLYCNYYHKGELLQLPKKIKAGFYGLGSRYSLTGCNDADLPGIIESHQFLNHDNNGLTRELMNQVEKLFPNKSRFEK